MTRTTKLATLTAGILFAGALLSPATYAADEPAAAQNVTTVWVAGKGQSGFAEKLNKMHAEMEAKGWKFGDMQLYTENGDMQGAFITYVR